MFEWRARVPTRPIQAILSTAALLLTGAAGAIACPQSYTTEPDLGLYYSSAAGLDGEALKSALNLTISGHTDLGYSCVWDMLRMADEDPMDSDSVLGFYTRRSILKTDRDFGLNTPDVWNREHIWARSHGIGSSGYGNSDAHHIRATDKSVNADRASKDFANGGSAHAECTGCTFTATTWSPPAEVRGDTARMMFYVSTRYEGGDGVPDLELVDASGTSGNIHGDLCDLVQWHLDDPVSAEEQARNSIIYSFQGNRNPFIDEPDYALLIWGPQCGIELPPPTVVPAVPRPGLLAQALLLSLAGIALFLSIRLRQATRG